MSENNFHGKAIMEKLELKPSNHLKNWNIILMDIQQFNQIVILLFQYKEIMNSDI